MSRLELPTHVYRGALLRPHGRLVPFPCEETHAHRYRPCARKTPRASNATKGFCFTRRYLATFRTHSGTHVYLVMPRV